VALTITNLGSGQYRIGGVGLSGQAYQILSAPQLPASNWLSLGSVTANVQGAFAFVDSTNLPRRFYRSLGPQGSSITNVTAGLLAWWKLDEGSGTNVADSSGNGHDGHFYTASSPYNTFPVWTTGVIGSGLAFNLYQCVQTANFADSLSNFTVACWYQIGSNTVPGQLQMVNKFDDNGIDGAGWVLMNESGDITFAWGGATCYAEGGGDTHTDHAWNHVVCCISGTNLVQWNNGNPVIQAMLLTCPFASYSNSGPVRIGWDARPSGGPDSGFVGILDDIRIYNRVLSPSEVQMLYRWRGEP
jgi:hypothetical protein